MAYVTTAIARRADDTKVPHQPLEPAITRVQASVATSIVLRLLLRIVSSAAALLSQDLLDYRILYKTPSLRVHHMNQEWHVRIQMQEMMLSIVRNAVAPTVPCLELPRRTATALAAFWKAQFLNRTHTQFQVFIVSEYQSSTSAVITSPV